MTIQKAGIGAAIPLLFNPGALGVVAIGAVGWGLFKLLRDDEEDGCNEPSDTVQEPPAKTQVATIAAYRTTLVDSQKTTQLETVLNPNEEAETPSKSGECDEDAERSLMIRQAMSELGKRSAAARAKRKAAACEGVVVEN
jgi:hypothetical protein